MNGKCLKVSMSYLVRADESSAVMREGERGMMEGALPLINGNKGESSQWFAKGEIGEITDRGYRVKWVIRGDRCCLGMDEDGCEQ
jgi:hypothetical protein